MEMQRELTECQGRELQTIYSFLKSEGLTFTESTQLILKMEDIYNNLDPVSPTISLSKLTSIIKDLFEDNFFDTSFLLSLLQMASQTSIDWGILYSRV